MQERLSGKRAWKTSCVAPQLNGLTSVCANAERVTSLAGGNQLQLEV